VFTKIPYSNKLKQLYLDAFTFKDIWAQNDSCEAFFQLLPKYSWRSKLDFKLLRHVVCKKCKSETITEESQNCISLQCDGNSLD
jgi:hypothetical protein